MLKKFAFILIANLTFFIFLSSQAFAAPTVTQLSESADQVGQYKKFEITFQISKSFPADSFLPYYFYDPSDTPSSDPNRNSPYGVDGISIDAHFTSPSGKQLTVPAFYHQQYQKSGSTLTATNNYSWKVRFAPEETGNYQYYITVQDKTGTTRYPASGSNGFQVTTSTSPGFVRPSTRDPRFWDFSNGSSFIPNSSGHQYWEDGRSTDYVNTFQQFKQYGINFLRIWDQNDGYALTVEGPYDAYIYPDGYRPTDRGIDIDSLPKGTQMNQRGNFEEDLIIEAAEQNGVYIQLCSHGDAYWIWDAAVYNESWNKNPVNFDDPQHLNYWKRNFRYRVARWGYSTSVFAWELWNEHGHISSSDDAYKFYQQYANYQKQTDPYNHMRTTSQGSQAWSPGFWSSAAFDLANYHDYMMTSRYNSSLAQDAANFVYQFAQCLRDKANCNISVGDGSNWNGPVKPIIWGELDTGTSQWNVANPQPRGTHNMRWSGLFSPIGMAPVDWYFKEQSDSFINTKHKEAKIASDFFKDVDYAGSKFTYLSTPDVRVSSQQLSASPDKLRVLAMRSQDGQQLFAWAQHKDHIWKNSGTPSAISGNFTVGGMQNGQYKIEYWNTYTGQVTSNNVTVNGGSITVPVNSLSDDVAIKIRPTNYTPTNTPVVTATPTQSIVCKADISKDGTVDLTDYSMLISAFFEKGDRPEDLDDNGTVDLTDYSILISHFFEKCTQ